jgi:hypothetical protein
LKKKYLGRIITWILCALAAFTLVLVFWPPAGSIEPASAEAARSFDAKLEQLEAAHERQEPFEVQLTGAEVNSKLQQIFSDVPSSGLTRMRGVAVSLRQDHLIAVLSLKVAGLSLYITLGGKPSIKDHRLQFNLDEVRLGHMPTAATLISEVLEAKLNSAQGQEMLLMPDYMSDMRVENGELVIESK